MTRALFTRTDLARVPEQGGQFREQRDVKWINPREFHRKALADVEDLGYQVHREVEEGIEIERENIGEKTGHVTSWIGGTKDLVLPARGVWKPYQVPGFVLTAIGGILMVIGLAILAGEEGTALTLLVIGLALLACGLFLATYQKKEDFLMHGVLSLRLLAKGEATERTIQRPGAQVTDLFAQLSVSYDSCNFCKFVLTNCLAKNLAGRLVGLLSSASKLFPRMQTWCSRLEPL